MGHIIHENFDKYFFMGIFVSVIILIINQMLISAIAVSYDSASPGKGFLSFGGKKVNVKDVDISEIQSTQMAVALLFPELKSMKSEDDALGIMIPTGAPDYSDKLGGITFDDPVTSLEYLAKWYYSFKDEVKKNDPEVWQRYLSLATQPRGISCEFCCGVGPSGVSKNGELLCGCQHNPAVQALTLGLMKNTDYTDAEVLREVMRWKALFFPKNMIETALAVAGKDASELKQLPGMVGGC